MKPVPWVILVTGPPGSGKSTTGVAIARRLGAALIDQDSMTNPLVDVIANRIGASGYDDPQLSALVRQARYECVFAAALDCVRAGTSSVLVAPFTQERTHLATWNGLAERVSKAGGAPVMAWIRISETALSSRLTARAAERDRTKLVDLPGYLASLDMRPPVGPFAEIDAEHGAKAQAAHLEGALSSAGYAAIARKN